MTRSHKPGSDSEDELEEELLDSPACADAGVAACFGTGAGAQELDAAPDPLALALAAPLVLALAAFAEAARAFLGAGCAPSLPAAPAEPSTAGPPCSKMPGTVHSRPV